MGVPTDKCGHDDLVWSRYSVSGLTSVNIVGFLINLILAYCSSHLHEFYVTNSHLKQSAHFHCMYAKNIIG